MLPPNHVIADFKLEHNRLPLDDFNLAQLPTVRNGFNNGLPQFWFAEQLNTQTLQLCLWTWQVSGCLCMVSMQQWLFWYMIPQVLQAPLKVNMLFPMLKIAANFIWKGQRLPVMHATDRSRSVMGQGNCATGNIDLFRWWPLFQGTLPLVNGCGWQGQCHFFVRFSHMKIRVFNFLQVFATPQVLFKSSLKVTKKTDMIQHGYNHSRK